MMFKHYLTEQVKLHPSAEPRDIIKLCFQAAFGAEHLLGDIPRVRDYFNEEFQNVRERDGLLFEPIADDVCRVNLAVWKKQQLPDEWLFNLFVLSASFKREKGEEFFWEYMAQAEEMGLLHSADGSPLEEYKKGGLKPVHHSDVYRANESPSYRVVSGWYVRLLPIFHYLGGCGDCNIIAIDGRAGSGKSTLAAHLADVTGAGVVHMDDFFLPKELRTKERLAVPGGNFHYERFSAEVLPFLRDSDAFSYGVFDCGLMELNGTRTVASSHLRIVEGAYCCHPLLSGFADMRVFSDISQEEQRRRIEARNGKEAAMNYVSKWIPMEETYLRVHGIKEQAHVVV